MLPFNSTEGLTLQVFAAESMTEIFVVNGDLQLVARGTGSVTATPIPPGIYRIKSRIGAETASSSSRWSTATGGQATAVRLRLA